MHLQVFPCTWIFLNVLLFVSCPICFLYLSCFSFHYGWDNANANWCLSVKAEGEGSLIELKATYRILSPIRTWVLCIMCCFVQFCLVLHFVLVLVTVLYMLLLFVSLLLYYYYYYYIILLLYYYYYRFIAPGFYLLFHIFVFMI